MKKVKSVHCEVTGKLHSIKEDMQQCLFPWCYCKRSKKEVKNENK
jgi:hypothetical protein